MARSGPLILAAGLVAANAAPGLGSVGRLRFPGVVRRLPGDVPAVALTFDDGPHPRGTPAILAELDRLGLCATFFVMHDSAARHEGLVRAMCAAGHRVELHGAGHAPHPLRNPHRLTADLATAQRTLENVTGQSVRAIRAPFGATSLATLQYARRHGLLLVSWTRWGRDWQAAATADSIGRRVARGLRAGDILLLHDSDRYGASGSYGRTCRALPAIAHALQRSGLGTRLLPVADGAEARSWS